MRLFERHVDPWLDPDAIPAGLPDPLCGNPTLLSQREEGLPVVRPQRYDHSRGGFAEEQRIGPEPARREPDARSQKIRGSARQVTSGHSTRASLSASARERGPGTGVRISGPSSVMKLSLACQAGRKHYASRSWLNRVAWPREGWLRRMRESQQGSGIRLRSDGIEIQGIRVPLYSAGFPYWELPPSRWERALDAAVELRLRLLRLDIPWVLHEQSPGTWDWGTRRAELDLPQLLKLAHARGLFVLARPGPWLGRSFPEGGGLPPRLLASREVRALDAHGTRWPVPSPVSQMLAAEAEGWLEAVSECLSPYVYPQGPIVAWISGGVGPLPSLWGGGALDRSKDALAFFARFVEVKYPSTQVPVGFPPSLGPLRVEHLEHCIAWVEAGELAERSLVTRLAPPEPSAPETAAGQSTKLPVLAAEDDPGGAAGADAFATSLDAEAVSLIFPEDAEREFSAVRLLGLLGRNTDPAAYPKVLYTASGETKTVDDEDEQAALGAGWEETPAAFKGRG